MKRWSPSAITAYLACPQRYLIFRIRKATAPPAVALELGSATHRTFEADLRNKMVVGANLNDDELLEAYLSGIRSNDALAAAADLEDFGGLTRLYDGEAEEFPRLLADSRKWREMVTPVGVEETFEGELGGIPMMGIADVVTPDKVSDIKRRFRSAKGRSPSPHTSEEAVSSIQLVTYSVLANRDRVSFVNLLERSKDRLVECEAEITPSAVDRVAAQVEGVIRSIDAEIFPPVDKSGPGGYVCSARFCGAWKRDARDIITGELISCPFGERASVTP